MAGQNEFIDLERKRGNIHSVVQPSGVQPRTVWSTRKPVPFTLNELKVKQTLQQAFQAEPDSKGFTPHDPVLKGFTPHEPVLKGFTPHQTLPNFNQLPNPTLAHAEKAWKKIRAVTTDQPTKTFTEGSPLSLTEDGNANEFGVDLRKDTSKAFECGVNLKSDVPATKYTPG
jgi:hypothetical protein